MPRVTPYSVPKDDTPVTLSSIKQIVEQAVETAIKSVMEQLNTRVSVLEQKCSAIDSTISTNEQDIADIKVKEKSTHNKISSLETAVESARRHSYSFELLLHGVTENENQTSEWETVQSFFNKHNLQEFLAALEGTSYRLGKPRDDATRPRPILFRLITRTARGPLLAKAGKKALSPNEAYLSAHLTKLQLEDLRKKATGQSLLPTGSHVMEQ